MRLVFHVLVLLMVVTLLWAVYNAGLQPPQPQLQPPVVDWNDTWLQWEGNTGEPAWPMQGHEQYHVTPPVKENFGPYLPTPKDEQPAPLELEPAPQPRPRPRPRPRPKGPFTLC